MKNITIRYFAAFRDATGTSEEQILSDAESLKALFAERAGVFAALEVESAAQVAVNDVLVSWDQSFEDGDLVLFFPPVAGG